MHPRLFIFAIAIAATSGAARAQNQPAQAPIAQPSTPAPVVVATPPLAANASTGLAMPESSAPAPSVTPATSQPRVTQTVYTPNLPTAQELTDAAAAQGFTVERITQTPLQMIAFYRSANGQSLTVAYQTLPPAAVAQTPQPPAIVQTPAPPVVVSAPQTVVYESAPRVIYYDAPPYYYPGYYYPRYWGPPVSFSFGFGYRGGHYHRR